MSCVDRLGHDSPTILLLPTNNPASCLKIAHNVHIIPSCPHSVHIAMSAILHISFLRDYDEHMCIHICTKETGESSLIEKHIIIIPSIK